MNKTPAKPIFLIKSISGQEGTGILIYGNPAGLKTLALTLMELSEMDQENDKGLPEGIGRHCHFVPGRQLHEKSDKTIIGRIDGKGNGDMSWLIFYGRDGRLTSVEE